MIGIGLKKDSEGSYDLDLSSGAMELQEVTHQNQALILRAHPGDYTEHPEVGVGIDDILLDHDLVYWRRRITEQLERDGQQVNRLRLTTTALDFDAEYK